MFGGYRHFKRNLSFYFIPKKKIPKFKVALNPMYRILFKLLPKVACYPAFQNLIKGFTVPFLKYILVCSIYTLNFD